MITYKKAGVDIKTSDKFTEFLEKKSKAIGGFAGLFDIKKYGADYSLVASTDGIGTKLKLAFLLNKHDTIGIDLVAMCVNDLICCGAKPLFFLDYYATAGLDLEKSKKIIEGIIEGCKQSDMILLGGETAEMPGFYSKGEYDLAGFAVGIVKNSEIIDGRKVKPGDTIIGIKSSGFHSNGYSLIRKVLEEKKLLKKYARELLTPTIIYVKTVEKIKTALKKRDSEILSIAHITGSGIEGNLERVIPKNVDCVINKNMWKIPKIMSDIQKIGNIGEKEMFSTFNMGIGMIIIVKDKDVQTVLKNEPKSMVIGKVEKGSGKVVIN
ncbi:MAG: phosphoribosylformylglycinamidine cyclo-ligase [Elusimicrobiales bacterium]|nr:phosphoribosylformylglycinamidine cyclo-ligase [Elusimicrobiales bacterium]